MIQDGELRECLTSFPLFTKKKIKLALHGRGGRKKPGQKDFIDLNLG
jgi:hypothetical protein